MKYGLIWIGRKLSARLSTRPSQTIYCGLLPACLLPREVNMCVYVSLPINQWVVIYNLQNVSSTLEHYKHAN